MRLKPSKAAVYTIRQLKLTAIRNCTLLKLMRFVIAVHFSERITMMQ
jgi:hypothetical protein